MKKSICKNLFIVLFIALFWAGLAGLAVQQYIIGGTAMTLFLAIALFVYWACK